MKWEKLGRVYAVEKLVADWCVSHTANPYPEHLHDDVFRIYFSCRDKINRSYITYVDVDIQTLEVFGHPTECLLGPGQPGLFDDSGCSLGCVLTTPQNEKRIYYLGWHLTKVAPWGNFIGMATLNPQTGKYEKHSRAPIIDRTDADPFSITTTLRFLWRTGNTECGSAPTCNGRWVPPQPTTACAARSKPENLVTGSTEMYPTEYVLKGKTTQNTPLPDLQSFGKRVCIKCSILTGGRHTVSVTRNPRMATNGFERTMKSEWMYPKTAGTPK